MKKRTISLLAPMFLVILLTIIIGSIKWNTKFHIELGNTTQFKSIDLKVTLDGETVYDDTLRPYIIPWEIDHQLRMGYYDIVISSEKANVRLTDKVLIIPGKYLFIVFYGQSEYTEKPKFLLLTGYGMFRYV